MEKEVFLGKLELERIFSKQSTDDFIHNNQVVYYLNIPILLFFLENKRKGKYLISEMEKFIDAIESSFEHNIIPINLSVDSIQEALMDDGYTLHKVSKLMNPYVLSAQTSLLYGNCWWECTGLESFIDNYFSI